MQERGRALCDPVTAAAAIAVTQVISTGAQLVAQTKSANAQERATRAQMEVQAEETRTEATHEMFEQMRATRREQARIRAAAGEAGLSLSSGSIEALLADSAMQGELANDKTVANLESRRRANTAEAESTLSQIQKPTALGAGVRLAAAGAQGWSAVEAAKIKTKG